MQKKREYDLTPEQVASIRARHGKGEDMSAIARSLNIKERYIHEIIWNYKYSDLMYTLRPNPEDIKDMIERLYSAQLGYFKIANIVFKLYGRRLCINTIRTILGKTTVRELQNPQNKRQNKKEEN